MQKDQLKAWVDGYVGAWESNQPDDIRRLFTEDAVYYTAPHRDPWRGGKAIVAGWLDRKDERGTWHFEYEVVAICDGLGFVQGKTTYTDPPIAYSNLWVIKLDEAGRSSEFTEWWMLEREEG